MKILLVCTLGVSTSLLVKHMQEVADPEDFIEAQGVGNLEEAIHDFDVVLVGPQIAWKYKQLEKFCKDNNKPCGLIDPVIYGRFDGPAAMKLVNRIVAESEANKE